MTTCSHCGAENRDVARFCFNCAAPLQPLPSHSTCPQCGTHNLAQAKYCHQCAAPLQGAAPLTGTLPPQTLLAGRYLILGKVGQGGMGAVYEAFDTRIPDKRWAIKELSDAASTKPEDKLRVAKAFAQEAQMLSRLNHANLPRVVDHFGENGRQYLVMDFVEGETLEHRFAQRGELPFSEAEVLAWAEQLCDVLGYLHRQRPPIIFRDLKPGNIMLDAQGQVKLIDFGIARLFKPGKATDTASFGTAGYAPPEQYGKGQTDARSDLYALGATMHQLLTGHDPALTPFQFEPVRKLNPAVSPEIEQVIVRAVEQDPGRRWPDAGAMRQALKAIPSQPARASVQAPSRGALARQAGAPPTGGSRAGSPAIAAPKVAAVSTSVSSPAAPSATPSAQRKAGRGWIWFGALILLVAIAVAVWQMQEAQRLSREIAAIEWANEQATVQARATATAQSVVATATTAAQQGDLVAGPDDGSLAHAEDGYIESYYAIGGLRNFMAEATFTNPYAASEGSWDYGFLFRGNSGDFHAVQVNSSGYWKHWLRVNGEDNYLESGNLNNVNRNATEGNHLRVIATGNTGLFFVNGQFVSELDLSGFTEAGGVEVATGMSYGDEINGKTTRFEDFAVWSLD